MNMMSDFDKVDILLVNTNANLLQRGLGNAVEGSINNEDTESFPISELILPEKMNL